MSGLQVALVVLGVAVFALAVAVVILGNVVRRLVVRDESEADRLDTWVIHP